MLLIPRTYTLNGESALALYLAQSHTQVAHGVGGKRPPCPFPWAVFEMS